MYEALVLFEIFLAVVTLLGLTFVRAPYGRYNRRGFGVQVKSRWGWVVMESPASIFFTYIYFRGAHFKDPGRLIRLFVWQMHYCYRSFVYPLLVRQQSDNKKMPLLIVILAFVFNILNAYVNARCISHFCPIPSVLSSVFGLTIFFFGFAINVYHDFILRGLRFSGSDEYSIPPGGLFQYVASPNYFGEIIEWIGWALSTSSEAGFAFALYTISNLAPRAASHHHWYRKKFKDYPPSRKRLIPFLW